MCGIKGEFQRKLTKSQYTFTIWPYKPHPRAYEFRNFGKGLHGYHNHAIRFFLRYVGVEKKIFERFAFLHIWFRLWRPGAGRSMNFTIWISLTIEMRHTKNGNNWPCSFEEEVTNVKL